MTVQDMIDIFKRNPHGWCRRGCNIAISKLRDFPDNTPILEVARARIIGPEWAYFWSRDVGYTRLMAKFAVKPHELPYIIYTPTQYYWDMLQTQWHVHRLARKYRPSDTVRMHRSSSYYVAAALEMMRDQNYVKLPLREVPDYPQQVRTYRTSGTRMTHEAYKA